jgi:hypothetical protein
MTAPLPVGAAAEEVAEPIAMLASMGKNEDQTPALGGPSLTDRGAGW